MLRIGIDEAGYGPTLGPLAVMAAAAEIADPPACAAALAGYGVADSKKVHRSGALAPLERVALAGARWLTRAPLATAGELFTHLGEPATFRAGIPWMAGAESMALPVTAAGHDLPCWDPPAIPVGLHGRLLHPQQLNACRRRNVNRAAAELEVVRDLLAATAPDPGLPARIACDRLGGRKRYGDLLERAWPGAPVEIIEETSPACRYRCRSVEVGFLVGGEDAEPLVALASCIAKYARELHMLLFNRHWGAQHPGLAPTAGYPEDAKRWLAGLSAAELMTWRDELIRA